VNSTTGIPKPGFSEKPGFFVGKFI
jgi:hypothetical protein